MTNGEGIETVSGAERSAERHPKAVKQHPSRGGARFIRAYYRSPRCYLDVFQRDAVPGMSVIGAAWTTSFVQRRRDKRPAVQREEDHRDPEDQHGG